MRENIYPKQLTLSRRARVLAVATLASGLLVAGCGGSSPNHSAISTSASTSSATTAGGSGTGSDVGTKSSGSTAPDAGDPGLAFAECMRANGVPNFPDPEPGRGLLFSTDGINPAAPAVEAAQAKCKKTLPNGGPPGPGTQMHPSAETMAKLVRIARCMRQHGISQFPDPRTSVPSNLGDVQLITDFDGAVLVYPSTFNLQAPAYKQALAACGAPPLGLPH